MEEEEVDITEPSLGDLVAAKIQKPISIAEAFPSENGALIPEAVKPVAIPSGISIATVLNQALRTNDDHLLESCLQHPDTQIVRSTIQRMDPSLAGFLMHKLAERLSSRPGRYGNLLVWVQWICVAHGGAIGSNPNILSKIKTLYEVLNQRSKSLDSLLLLKGKLDMLDAQLSLRKQLLADRDLARDPDEGHVVYIEGEDHDESSDEDEAVRNGNAATAPHGSRKAINPGDFGQYSQEGSDDDEQMPTTNGFAESNDSDFDSDGHQEGPIQHNELGLMDDEADESDENSQASGQEDERSEDEVDSGDEEDDSEMEDFIDDGSIEEPDTASEVSIDEISEQPSSKTQKRK